MRPRKHPSRPFRSAKQELQHATRPSVSPSAKSSAYRLAFTDQEFLLRRELRAVRLQLELLKPELILHDQRIKSTVVIFGSARIPEAEQTKKHLHELQEKLNRHPQDEKLMKKIAIAERVLAKAWYYEEARRLGKIISLEGKDELGNPYVISTGGGPGIMEAANRGAYEVAAKNIGLNIVLPMEQDPNHYITPELCFQFHYFAIRKMHFLIRAKAAIFFPGGFGTFDELFEVLTLVQTKKIDPMPIILFGREYWQRVVNFDTLIDEGVISPEDINIFEYAETAEQAWEKIKSFYTAK